MIDYKEQLKVQAYLDGELPQAEAGRLAAWLARDGEAAALGNELRQTRAALAGFEASLKLPETREFYWSKIQREIQRQEALGGAASPREPLLEGLRRLLRPATAVALLALLGFVVTKQVLPQGSIAASETALADSGALTYRDYSAGATLVWLSYPADSEEDEAGSLD